MQLKGLVKFFTIALILISLYQLSFTFLVRNVEKAYRAKALKEVKATNPNATADQIKVLAENRYDALSDSLQGEKVISLLFKKYTFQEAKAQELNLGLDLQGGMNVTLDVSLDELVRSLSNNPTDPALNAAIAQADKEKANSQEDFVTLFGKAYKGSNIASLFTKPGEKEITLESTKEQVLARIKKEAEEAITSTYNVIQKRIDKFGVSQPNVNLDKNRGVISVELAGVRNPERVREFLQSTAKLQFFEMYAEDPAIIEALNKADEALGLQLSGGKTANHSDTAKTASTIGAATDTNKVAAANAADSGKSLSDLMAASGTSKGDTGALAAAMKHPISSLFVSPTKETYSRAAIGYLPKKNIAKFFEYVNSDVVKNALPIDAKFALGADNPDTKYDAKQPLPVYVLKTLPGTGEAKLEGDHIVDARMDFDQTSGEPEVLMDMDPTGANIWAKMTRENAGKYLAVVLDDRVYSAPYNREEISGGRTSISGHFTSQTATDLSNILKIGKLPAPAHIVQEQVVGPTLGAENIAAGISSLAIAFIVIFVLMLVYYNTGGIVANIALILNVLFTIGILSALHATLTMPGIAGLVLTIGMAVDTNVIIFERIKEELALGKSYHVAVNDGYKRSYAPVLDGHITQLLTAIILFVFGLGPVRGFATTQIIGLLLSLFCGILVSRLITDMWTKRERHFKYFTRISKSIFRKAHFKFIEARKITYVISGCVLLLGIGSFLNGFDYGVDFAGGRSYDIRFAKEHTTNEIRDILKPFFAGESPIVKTIGTDNTYNITTSYLIKDPNKDATDQVRAKLYEGLKAGGLIPATTTAEDFKTQYLGGSGMEKTVLPIISEDLKRGAVKATVISLLAIFLYILIRFRKWQYSLGTILSLIHDVCITLAVFSFFKGHVPFALEIDQHFIAAILTVIGFSMNDTIIVFDRVREYFRKSPGEGKKSIINRAINDTLSRTIMTSLSVFLTVLILFIFGGEVLRGFAFAMLIGVVAGTYSSIFVAAPILVDLDKKDALKNEVNKEARIEELKKLA
ncbi:MAG: protein translocase subunit SecDF [Chitinophagaceae bacterium]